jgi:hypothetical protein
VQNAATIRARTPSPGQGSGRRAGLSLREQIGVGAPQRRAHPFPADRLGRQEIRRMAGRAPPALGGLRLGPPARPVARPAPRARPRRRGLSPAGQAPLAQTPHRARLPSFVNTKAHRGPTRVRAAHRGHHPAAVATDTLERRERNHRPHSAGRRPIDSGSRRSWNEPAYCVVRMQPAAAMRSTGCDAIARPSNTEHSTR